MTTKKRILQYLEKNDNVPQNQIVSDLNLDKGNTSRLMKRLEKEEIIIRDPINNVNYVRLSKIPTTKQPKEQPKKKTILKKKDLEKEQPIQLNTPKFALDDIYKIIDKEFELIREEIQKKFDRIDNQKIQPIQQKIIEPLFQEHIKEFMAYIIENNIKGFNFVTKDKQGKIRTPNTKPFSIYHDYLLKKMREDNK